MIRRLPIVATIVVLIAAGIMVRLGFWQLDRLGEKEALIAQYEAALINPDLVDWPSPERYESVLFRRSKIDCREVQGIDAISGKSIHQHSGWVHVARCQYDGAGTADVTIGWSNNPQAPEWKGGEVSGRIAPYGDAVRLITDEPQAGLAPLAQPDPRDLPNNHLAYAVQWFLFALVALVIYGLAIKKRLKEQA